MPILTQNTDKEIHNVIDTYKSTVYGIALVRVGSVHDADDIFQEVFMAYFKKPRMFMNENHRKGWIIKTTIICCQQYFKHKSIIVGELSDEMGVSPIQNESYQHVLDALFGLEEKYRIVLYLYYFESYSTKEIASTLGLKEGTVRMQMKRGRDALKGMLEEPFDE